MAFLPFYLARSEPLSVVILGGGYAGLAALVSIHRFCPTARVTLIDPEPAHIKVTHLHETTRRSLNEFKIPFETIARRFGCRFIQARIEVSESKIEEWWNDRCIPINDSVIDFDCLLIATGEGAVEQSHGDGVYQLGHFTRAELRTVIDQIASAGESSISVVGAGATGIQFLFEIANYIRDQRLLLRLRLVDGEDRPLKQFAAPLGQYVEARVADLGIDYLPGTFFIEQAPGRIRLQRPGESESFELESSASFLFLGKRTETALQTNVFGQVVREGRTLPGVFAAGDCARYRGPGSNSLTAQSAVRKGRLAARNILRWSGRLKLMEPYIHRDLGYVISLGSDDAVGWLALEGNVVAGAPALVVKGLVEAQYDLLLAGIDTYII